MKPIDIIKATKVVAVIRKADEENIVPILKALSAGGVKAVEITAETPNVANIIAVAKEAMGEESCIGAGTVLDSETARAVMLAGADFIVSPSLSIETLKLTNRYGMLYIPGVLTPTEIVTAYEYGASMVKIFPASTVGPSYMKNILGPLPHVEAMVTGGITLENMNDYLQQGAKAVGIGSNLVNVTKLKTEADYKKLEEEARSYIQAIS